MTDPTREGFRADERAHGVRRSFIERSIAAAYRARSLESRASSVLSLIVVCILGAGLLAWYYGAALKRPAQAAEAARARAASSAQAEMPLPPLEIPPAAGPRGSSSSLPSQASLPPTAPAQTSSPPSANTPEPASRVPAAAIPWLTAFAASPSVPLSAGVSRTPFGAEKSPRRRALDRRLAGPAFAAESGSTPTQESAASPAPAGTTTQSPLLTELPSAATSPSGANSVQATRSSPTPDGLGAPGELTKLLTPVIAPAVTAQVLPTRTLLLPRGAFIDCTLETAIDSTLPGMTTCITATDTFGADGKVVLLERGSKLVGETRGEVSQASSRVFVLWTEARTPTGVVIPLASPGTDELGRSGLPGTVNRHFFERFGAALLISIIDVGAQVAATSGSGTVIYSPTTSQNVMSEVLNDTLRIPPTVVKNQGDRIQVLVARDLDFRSVYELRAQNHGG